MFALGMHQIFKLKKAALRGLHTGGIKRCTMKPIHLNGPTNFKIQNS